jgi:hypothetical protein
MSTESTLRSGLRTELRQRLREESARPHDGDADALTDLFLGDSGPLAIIMPRGESHSPAAPGPATSHAADRSEPREAGGPPPTPPARAEIELVVLGHLPVMASAWATQHARAVAKELKGPVAVVRLTDEAVVVEVVGEASPELARQAVGTLPDAIAALGASVVRWMVRVPETLEPEVSAASGLDRVTLLTGADEAAVVGLYRAIKGLHECRAFGADSSRQLGVSVMGAAAEKSQGAIERVRKAARAFLSVDLASVTVVSKIGPGSIRTAYRGSVNMDAAALVEMIRGQMQAPRTVARSVPRLATQESAVDHGRHEPAVEDARAGEFDMHELLGDEGPEAVEPEAMSPGTVSEMIHGLSPVELRCPVATDVEWALDARGGLHALARAREQPSAMVEALFAAAGWASLNRELIGRVLPGAKDISRPTLHLLCEKPREARHLLDAPLRVHAVVRAGGEETVVELN